jgi:CheY-like chemotaxis protein
VLSIGQCGLDNRSIGNLIQKHFQAEYVAADYTEDAFVQLREGGVALVLVNRVFDANGALGLELIKEIKAEEAYRDVPVMLVSNYDDAQREAMAAGAVRGFGKSALGDPATIERLRQYLPAKR